MMMAHYTLDLLFDVQSLRTIVTAQYKITLAKQVNETSPNVVWYAFDPFLANKVQWEEEYGLYAVGNPTMRDGSALSAKSDKFPVCDAAYYVLDSNGIFNGPYTDESAPEKGAYQIENQMPYAEYPSLAFGLEQTANINGVNMAVSPINSALVPSHLDTVFMPHNTLYIWLQNQFNSGTFIAKMNGNATQVNFGVDVNEMSLRYDPNNGRFVPLNDEGKPFNDPNVLFLPMSKD